MITKIDLYLERQTDKKRKGRFLARIGTKISPVQNLVHQVKFRNLAENTQKESKRDAITRHHHRILQAVRRDITVVVTKRETILQQEIERLKENM